MDIAYTEQDGIFVHVTRSIGTDGNMEMSCDCPHKSLHTCIHRYLIQKYWTVINVQKTVISVVDSQPSVCLLFTQNHSQYPYLCVLSLLSASSLDFRHTSTKRVIVKLLPTGEWSCSINCKFVR